MIPVTCAIIEKDNRILCAQRSENMKLPLKWEFPGGKIEEDESPEACLHREIREELGLEIELLEQLPTFSHSYSADFDIKLLPFRCRITGGKLRLAEHKQIQWLPLEELQTVDWAEADVPIIEYYIQNFK